MFRHYRVMLGELVVNILPSYTNNSNAAVGKWLFVILYNDQQMHNYFTNYHTPTCFDTIVSCSGSLWSIFCQVTQIIQKHLLVIQFTIKTFHVGFMQFLILQSLKSQYYKIFRTLKLSYLQLP